jgi:hypothetical protein
MSTFQGVGRLGDQPGGSAEGLLFVGAIGLARHRFYTPIVTRWAFLSQVVSADGCCRAAETAAEARANGGFY